MILRATQSRRSGMSILEVLLAMAIFLMALIGLEQLLTVATDTAMETEFTNRSRQLCESKMNEVVAGVQPLTSQGDTPFDEDQAWSWSLDCQADSTVGTLYTVTVKVSRLKMNGTPFEATLVQMVIDPTTKGAVETPPSTSSSGTTGTTGGN